MQDIVDIVNQYGVPTVVAVGMAYFIFFIWKFVTNDILPTLGKATGTLIGLIDRVRMLDNDMIRLDQKINTIIEIQNQHSDPFDERTKEIKEFAEKIK
jgi:peptidoglycan hydrolase CwlO-like protein|tara:strand:- start:64 stop:357 length:294 start_codon:yes stop_codon:yes gene_type:complete